MRLKLWFAKEKWLFFSYKKYVIIGSMTIEEAAADESGMDSLIIGKRIRDIRTAKGLTLETVAASIGRAISHLSGIENGKRDPKLADLRSIAASLGVTLDDLLSSRIPTGRALLEVELERAQRGPLFKSLSLPELPTRKSLSDDAIKTILGLHAALQNMHSERASTPEQARRANTTLRREMRDQNNYFPELEQVAAELHTALGHSAGPLSQRLAADLAAHLGFSLHYVSDLPQSTRTVTDLKNMRIYLPRNTSADPRTTLLQALSAHVLGDRVASSYAEFLLHRVEINYLAGALLVPEKSASEYLKKAKEKRELAVEDLRDTYAVSYETAAHRFTNLATKHLGIPVHFMKVHSTGALAKAYENDGVLFPQDPLGSVEGQIVCRQWSARQVFSHDDRLTPFHQYTDKPNGTYWCTSRIESGKQGDFSISVGTPFEHVKWFRGRETKRRGYSGCPDESCCRVPPEELTGLWSEHSRPTAIVNSSLLAAMPKGPVPGVDQTDVFEFLENHAPRKK